MVGMERLMAQIIVPGVYAYTIDVLLNDGKDLKINGDVTVVR